MMLPPVMRLRLTASGLMLSTSVPQKRATGLPIEMQQSTVRFLASNEVGLKQQYDGLRDRRHGYFGCNGLAH